MDTRCFSIADLLAQAINSLFALILLVMMPCKPTWGLVCATTAHAQTAARDECEPAAIQAGQALLLASKGAFVDGGPPQQNFASARTRCEQPPGAGLQRKGLHRQMVGSCRYSQS